MGMEHQATAPAHRLPACGHRPAAGAVLQRETVEAVQQAMLPAPVHLPGEIQQPTFVAGRRLIEGGTGVAGAERVAEQPDRRMIHDGGDAAQIAAQQQAQVGAVVERRRLADRIAQRIA